MFFILIFVAFLAQSLGDRLHPNLRSNPTRNTENPELNSDFWLSQGRNILKDKVNARKNENFAKNIIFFIGDGMSLQNVAAARMYDNGREENYLSFEKFPHFGLSKTYCVDKAVPDSACSGTAYSSGIKANYGTIGVNGRIARYDCNNILDRSTYTDPITLWAQRAGKATGIVTTTRITDASPAAFYAHVADRYWQNDADLRKNGCDPELIDDIAEQLVYGEAGRNLKVILGGGRSHLRDENLFDEEASQVNLRTDRKNLIEEWLRMRENAAYVWNRTELISVDYSKVDYLLGLFESGHCQYNLDIKNKELVEEPSLTDMLKSALWMLQKEKNGFFLFVEGGRIDNAHHDNRPQKSLEETLEFSRAIDLARQMTNEQDTLIVVSSDHAHVMSYNGYPKRGDNDILGFSDNKDRTRTVDKLPYLTLSYANGPGYVNTYELGKPNRIEVNDEQIKDPNYAYSATVPLISETHGGDDVGIYASGPHSHIFAGNYEQNALPLMMAYAGNLEQYINQKSEGVFVQSSSLLTVILLVSSGIFATLGYC